MVTTRQSSHEIVPLLEKHWPTVRDIYADGLATGDASFEVEVPDWEAWDAARLAACRFVAVRNDRVVGWVALTPVSSKPELAGVAEVSVYVAARNRRRGIGKALLRRAVRASEEAGMWTLQAAVFPENDATIRLHMSEGFNVVGRRERIGLHEGRWRDTLLLERRSPRIG